MPLAVRRLKAAIFASLAYLSPSVVGAPLAAEAQSLSPQPGAPGYQDLAFAYARLASGDLNSALKFARRAREAAPGSETPVRVLVDVLLKLGRPGEALETIDVFAAAHGPSGPLLAQRGFLRKLLGDADGAARDFEAAREGGQMDESERRTTDSALFDLKMEAANKALVSGQFDAAIGLAKEAEKLNPNAEAPVSLIVDVERRRERPDAALSEADRFIAARKATWRVLAQRAFLRRAVNDLQGAEADFSAALAAPDMDAPSRKNLKEGLTEVRAAIRAAALAADLERASAALAKGDYLRAIRAAEAARVGNSGLEAPVLILMSAWSGLRQPRSAIEAADAFLKDNPASAAILAQRGYSLREIGDIAGASADFSAALAKPGLDPEQINRLRLALAEAENARKEAAAPAVPSAPSAPPVDQALNRAFAAEKAGNRAEALRAAREARALDPRAEAPALALIHILIGQGDKKAALAEANRFLATGARSASMLAQRGFLLRGKQDLDGAIADFSAALRIGLPPNQAPVVRRALEEARYASVAERAYRAAASRNWSSALQSSLEAEKFARADEGVFRVTIEALSGLGRRKEALAAANRLIARGGASGAAYAQRAYLRESEGDRAGAIADFREALRLGGLTAAQRVEARRGLAVAEAAVLEARGDMAQARETLVAFTRLYPRDADGWKVLGAFYARRKDFAEALAAYRTSLAISPRGEAYLEAGYAGIHVDHVLESHYFRAALDLWDKDPSLRARPPRDRDLVRAQTVEADGSLRTNIVLGAITDRPRYWGGTQGQPSFESDLLFDGRYLPYVNGLEVFVGALRSQDQTDFVEAYTRLGLRLRPIDNVNFSLSAEWQHYFAGNDAHDQLALSWGYGYGGFAYTSEPSAGAAAALQPTTQTTNYPLDSGWRPLTSFATYGQYRTGEGRYLQSAVGILGYACWDVEKRLVVGPSAMVYGSFDSADANPLAFGAGPALIARLWFGGNYYRSYDGAVSLQLGYLFPFGESARLGGVNAVLSFSF
ncbi:tetratricopeptide repeat protein [uncultured Rhodoblastus sp.]|uniref:NfrA family protein n=1 Tax=uncultured Rhodoblastus sp. TaxID=543037 RepID=UPI0025FDB5E7|nr:tetratricopeptide repeat protein [uncultured Rhodoblastus sp.]